MTRIGRVAELWRYPVKSMRGEALQSLAIDANGVVGDRYFALKDEDGRLGSGKTTKRFRQIDGLLAFSSAIENGKTMIRFPDGRAMPAEDPASGRALSAACGLEVRVESEDQDGTKHRDDAPLHLLSRASLAWLRTRLPGVAIDVRRFRPNFLLETEAEGLPEQAWVGRAIAIGDALTIKIVEPTVRCVMTTLPQAELEAAPGVLRKLGEANAASLGVYADVLRPGTVRVGDELRFV